MNPEEASEEEYRGMTLCAHCSFDVMKTGGRGMIYKGQWLCNPFRNSPYPNCYKLVKDRGEQLGSRDFRMLRHQVALAQALQRKAEKNLKREHGRLTETERRLGECEQVGIERGQQIDSLQEQVGFRAMWRACEEKAAHYEQTGEVLRQDYTVLLKRFKRLRKFMNGQTRACVNTAYLLANFERIMSGEGLTRPLVAHRAVAESVDDADA